MNFAVRNIFDFKGWLLMLVAAVSTEAAPQFEHLYLGYVSPFEFLQGSGHNGGQNAYQAYRNKRSAMGSMGYHYQPAAGHPTTHHNPMHYTPSFGYNPMTYPFKMYTFPAMPNFPHMPKFPQMKFPTMPAFHFPSYSNYHHPIMPSGNHYYGNNHNNNAGYRPSSYQPIAAPVAPATSHYPFGDHFMKMMGFHGSDHANTNNYNNNANTGNHGSYNHNNPKGNNYEKSYSSSYSMNMDYKNGKGHMVTKDSSYMNDNGKVYQNNGPAQHYTYGNGKFVPVNNYNQH